MLSWTSWKNSMSIITEVSHKSHFPRPSLVLNEEGLICRMTSEKNKVRGKSLFARVFTFPLEGRVGDKVNLLFKERYNFSSTLVTGL